MAMSLATSVSVRELQRTLASKSKSSPSFRFYSLYDKVYRTDVLSEAWRRVRANGGSSGADGTTLGDVERRGVDLFLSALQEELKTGRYRPTPLRRVYIPKANGKKRPLSIPTVKDRVVQQAVRTVIEPLFEVHFLPPSYGFRPKRGTHDAVREVVKLLNWGLVNVIETDIEDCFGAIPHQGLMRRLSARVADGRVLGLIRAWLRCGVMEQGAVRSAVAGTPQGGVISPLLANVYLDALDQEWNRQAMARREGANAHLVRYADDLVILTDKRPEAPSRLLFKTLRGLGLKPHPEKTRILDARTGNFDFLGFNLRKVRNPKTGKLFALMRPSRKAQAALRQKLRDATAPFVQKKVGDVVRQMNPVLRGWVNYFRIGNSAGVFAKVREYALCRLRRFMRRRQKRHGYGWKNVPNEFFYGPLGLFYDYRVDHSRPASATAR